MARKKELAPGAERRIANYIRKRLGQKMSWRGLDEICGTQSSDVQYDRVVGPLLADGVLVASSDKLHAGSAERPIMEEYLICAELPSELTASAALWEAAGAADQGAASEAAQGAAAETDAAHGADDADAAEGEAPAPRKRTRRGGRRRRKAGTATENGSADASLEDGGTDEAAQGEANPAQGEAAAAAATPTDATRTQAPSAPPAPAATPAPSAAEPPRPANQPAPPVPKQATPASKQPTRAPKQARPAAKQQRALAQPKPTPALPSPLDTLNPQLTRNGYLAGHPSAAKAWRRELQTLSQWLDEHPRDIEPALEEERSFEIFGNEKLIGQRGQQRGGVPFGILLKSMGVMNALAIEDVPIELRAYAPDAHRRLITVLIVENHCPYLRISDAMKEGQRTFFGRHIDALVYGEGGRVSAPGILARTQEAIARDATFKYLYWGDIDREGIAIYERLVRDAHIDLELLFPAYTAMLDAVNPETLPLGGKGSNYPTHAGIELAKQLNERQLETYIRVMMLGLRIPQEAVPVESYCHPRPTLSTVAQTARALPRKLPRPRLPWQR